MPSILWNESWVKKMMSFYRSWILPGNNQIRIIRPLLIKLIKIIIVNIISVHFSHPSRTFGPAAVCPKMFISESLFVFESGRCCRIRTKQCSRTVKRPLKRIRISKKNEYFIWMANSMMYKHVYYRLLSKFKLLFKIQTFQNSQE